MTMKKTLMLIIPFILGTLGIVSAQVSISNDKVIAPEEEELGESPWEDAGDYNQQHQPEKDVENAENIEYSYKPRDCSNNDIQFCFEKYGWNILHYLNPHVTQTEKLVEIRDKLRNGKVVIIRDAFIQEFADLMHKELLHLNFTLEERYDSNGFHVKQHNVYQLSDYTQNMLAAELIFGSQETRDLMAELSGRDCDGAVRTTASWFAPGGYVLPHSDHRESRTVSFVWHLSQNWLPEWGGALYWSTEKNEHAYVHASYNTLTLFSVTDKTIHMVTPVTEHATEMRLTWNGWWNAGWTPSPNDNLVSYLDTPEKRMHLTEAQVETLHQLIQGNHLDNKVRSDVERLLFLAEYESFGPPSVVHPLL
jgi:Rps23 Pro-64 3,4-dihydroxylase Tpa1-like proline 4-hydroxylase